MTNPASTDPTTATAEQASQQMSSWARTHCYICGADQTARTIELIDKMNADTLTPAEEDELATADCPNGCWAKETAAAQTS